MSHSQRNHVLRTAVWNQIRGLRTSSHTVVWFFFSLCGTSRSPYKHQKHQQIRYGSEQYSHGVPEIPSNNDILRRHQMTVRTSWIIGQSRVYSTICLYWQVRNIKGPRYCPFWWNSTGDWWIPAQWGSNAENVTIDDIILNCEDISSHTEPVGCCDLKNHMPSRKFYFGVYFPICAVTR